MGKKLGKRIVWSKVLGLEILLSFFRLNFDYDNYFVGYQPNSPKVFDNFP